MISITPSKLADYLACALKYRLKHIERKGSHYRSPALAFGTAVHRSLEDMYRVDPVQRDVEQILQSHWNRSDYFDPEQSQKLFAKGAMALEKYEAAFLNRPGALSRTLGTEVYLTYIVRHNGIEARLGAKADRVDVGTDIIEVVDYKTSSHGSVPTEESLRSDLPTFLYWLLARKRYPEYSEVRCSYLNVLTLAQSSVAYTPDEIATNKRALWDVIKRIASDDFAPRPSEGCSWCDFKDECPAASQVLDFDDII